MRKVFALLSLLFVLAIFAAEPSLFAQTAEGTPMAQIAPASDHLQEPPPKMPVKSAPQEEGMEIDEVVRVETSLVTVSATVMDRSGRYVSNLRQEDFLISENGIEQQIAYFEPVEKPFTVVLLLDTSGSTAFRLEDIRRAALAFIDQLRADDRVMVIAFNNGADVLAGPTNDREVLRSAINLKPSDGGTYLYDAMEFVLKEGLRGIQGRKAIVLFTDGVDNVSPSATFASSLRDIEEAEALIYPVQFDTFGEHVEVRSLAGYGGDVVIKRTKVYPPGFSAAHYKLAENYLHAAAQKSGGRFYHAGDLKKLSKAFALIAEELRRQYSLGYYPQTTALPGQRREINVRVSKRGFVVRARNSYTAPSKN